MHPYTCFFLLILFRTKLTLNLFRQLTYLKIEIENIIWWDGKVVFGPNNKNTKIKQWRGGGGRRCSWNVGSTIDALKYMIFIIKSFWTLIMHNRDMNPVFQLRAAYWNAFTWLAHAQIVTHLTCLTHAASNSTYQKQFLYLLQPWREFPSKFFGSSNEAMVNHLLCL